MNHPFAGFEALYEWGLETSQTPDSDLRRPRFYNLLQIFELVRNIPGCSAEAGCWRGLSSFLICNSIRDKDAEFTGAGHVIVDSFKGLSPPTAEDNLPEKFQGRFSNTSVDHVRNTLREFPNVSIFEGWIPDAFEKVPDQTYRFVHIDVDLFEPTRDSLEYFFPRVSHGGVMVVDDFGPWPAGGKYQGCSRAVIEFCKKNNIPFAALSTGNAVIFKK
ncbi:MAG: TylF/MycF/NovP-related O-methyltransferase [Pseudomonadota bacterium]